MKETIALAKEGMINTNASIKDQHSIIIQAPIEKVWTILTNVSGWKQWNPLIKHLSATDEVHPGSQFEWKIGRMSSSSEIQLMDKPGTFSWTGKSTFVKRIYVWSLETDENQTIATLGTSLEGLFTVWVENHRSVYNEIHQWLDCLKVKAEEA